MSLRWFGECCWKAKKRRISDFYQEEISAPPMEFSLLIQTASSRLILASRGSSSTLSSRRLRWRSPASLPRSMGRFGKDFRATCLRYTPWNECVRNFSKLFEIPSNLLAKSQFPHSLPSFPSLINDQLKIHTLTQLNFHSRILKITRKQDDKRRSLLEKSRRSYLQRH